MTAKELRRITCEQVRQYDLVGFLASMGIEPAYIKGHNFWYISPFRPERTPSFKINRQRNRWYDFGEGCGGNLIDFAIRFNQCTVAELLQMIASDNIPFRTMAKLPATAPLENSLTVISDHQLTSLALLSYLRSRMIPLTIAEAYCREVRYRIGGRSYFAIGFANDAGGYELRNEYFKGSSSPKTFTSFCKGRNKIAVFEGFFNFLSFIAITPLSDGIDYLVLNSLSMFERARAHMESYAEVHLYLDNNRSGKNCCRYALSLSDRYIDQSGLYQKYEDLNDLLTGRPM